MPCAPCMTPNPLPPGYLGNGFFQVSSSGTLAVELVGDDSATVAADWVILTPQFGAISTSTPEGYFPGVWNQREENEFFDATVISDLALGHVIDLYVEPFASSRTVEVAVLGPWQDLIEVYRGPNRQNPVLQMPFDVSDVKRHSDGEWARFYVYPKQGGIGRLQFRVTLDGDSGDNRAFPSSALADTLSVIVIG